MDQIRVDGQIGAEGTDESNDEIQRYDCNTTSRFLVFVVVKLNLCSSF